MADVAITEIEVDPDAAALTESVEAGEVVDVGMPYCVVGGLAFKSDANHATAARRVMRGLSVGAAEAAGQRFSGVTRGRVNIGATAAQAKGAVLIVSGTPGKLAPVADLAAGWAVTIAGVMDAGNVLDVRPWSTGIVK